MSQSYSSNCFSTANVIETDMQNVENNFDALRSLFSGSSAPTSPDAGQLWYDTGSSSVKIRYNSSWVEWWDMDGQCVAAGQVKTASLAAGALTADAAGRGKMANGFITDAHVNDVGAAKITGTLPSTIISYGSGQLIFSKAYSTAAGGAGVEAQIAFTPGSTVEKRILRINAFIPYGAKYVRGEMTGVCQDGCQLRIAVGTTYGSTGRMSNYSESTGSFGRLDVSTHAGQIKQVDVYASMANASKTLSIYSMALWFSNT